MSRACLSGCLLAVVLAATALAQPAPPSATADPRPPLRYRRVYAPVDDVRSWPLENTRYVPLDPQEFERLVAASGAAAAESNARRPGLERAEYWARLALPRTLEGTAAWHVRPAGAEPAPVALDPCGLAVTGWRWRSAEDPPRVGVDAAGRLQVLVERSDALLADWSLRGVDDRGAATFDLRVPRATRAVLHLDVPADLQPRVPAGVLLEEVTAAAAAPPANVRAPAAEDAADDAPDAAESRAIDVPPLASGFRRWRIDLGPRDRLSLRIEASPTAAPSIPPLVRRTETYELAQRGMQLSVQWTIDALGGPLRTLRVGIDPGLVPVAVRVGDKTERPVTWSPAPGAANGNEIVLEFPEPIEGPGRIVRLRAQGPVVPRKAWSLPQVRLLDVEWQEGATTLLVAAPLELRRLDLAGCRQTRFSTRAKPPGETWELENYEAAARVEVVLGEQPPRLLAESGTRITLTPDDIRAEARWRLSAPVGEAFSLRANVPAPWLIDAVEAAPPEMLDDWWLAAGPDGSYALRINLAEPLSSKRPLELTVRAHARETAVGRALKAEDLFPLSFSRIDVSERVIEVQTADEYAVRWRTPTGGQPAPLAAADLTPRQRALLPGEPRGLLSTLDAGALAARLVVDRRTPQIRADITLDAELAADTLLERHLLRLDVGGLAIDGLLVHFLEAREAPPRWSVSEGTAVVVRADRLLPEAATAAGIPAGGETWHLAFRAPVAGSVHLRAERVSPYRGATALALAALPEAREQSGHVIVTALANARPQVRSRGLAALPPTTRADATHRAALVEYRFDPSRLLDAGRHVELVVEPAVPTSPAAIVWSARNVVRWQPTRRQTVTVSLLVENLGSDRLALRLPQGAEVVETRVDGRRVPAPQGPAGLEIPLIPGVPLARVEVEFALAAPGCQLLATWQPPQIESDAPLVEQSWTLWVPPGYRVLPLDATGGAALSWLERLFGPLARDALLGASGRTAPRRAEGLSPAQAAATAAWLAALDEVRRAAPADGPLTWHDWLTEAARRRDLSADRVRVDALGLAAVGIGPNTRAPTAAEMAGAAGAADSSRDWLERCGLTLLAEPEGGLLLTTSTHAVESAAAKYAAGGLGPAAVRGGSVSGRISLPAWADWPQPVGEPLAHADAVGLGTSGWQAIELADRGVAPLVRLAHLDGLLAVRYSVMFIALALTAWLARGSIRRTAGLFAGAAAISLLAPEPVALLIAGCALGPLAWLPRVLVVRRPAVMPPAPVGESPSRRSGSGWIGTSATTLTRTAPLLAGLIVSVAADPLAAQTVPVAPPAAAPGKVHQVFVPADAEGRPVDGKYQVPAELYDALVGRAAQSPTAAGEWWLREAEYRLTLARGAEGQLVPGPLTGRWRLDVRTAPAQIPLPALGPEETLDAVRVDDRAVVPAYDALGRATLALDAPGTVEVEWTRVVRPQGGDGWQTVEVTVPPAATARWEVVAPADAAGLEFPSARGAVRNDAGTGVWKLDLGTTDRLALRWPTAPTGRAVTLDVEEYVWMRIRPGLVSVDLLARVRGMDDTLSALVIEADPRLRLLAGEGTDVELASLKTVAASPSQGGLARIEAGFARPVEGQASVRFSFLVNGATGVGRLQVPGVSTVGLRVERRWLAVTVDEQLRYTSSESDALKPLAVPEFLKQWGPSDFTPQLVFAAPPGPVPWQLAVRPAPTQTVADTRLTLVGDLPAATLRWQAKVGVTGGAVFQHVIDVPPHLAIERVSVREDGRELVARWSQTEPTALAVQLKEPLSVAHDIDVEGRLAVQPDAAFDLPRLALRGARENSAIYVVARVESTRVEVDELVGLARDDAAAAPSGAPGDERLVGAYRADQAAPSARLRVAPNRPSVECVQVATLRGEGADWDLELDSRWRVSDGLVDVLRWKLPNPQVTLLSVEPPMPASLVPSPDDRLNVLELRARTPLPPEQRVRVRLRVPTAALASLPEVAPLGALKVASYFRLPTQVGVELAEWQTTGLTPAELPSAWSADAAAQGQGLATYRVTGTRPRIERRGDSRRPTAAAVIAAHVQVVAPPAAAWHGLVEWTVVPGNLRHLDFDIPPEARVAAVWLDDVVAPAEPLDGGGLRIPLRGGGWPERVSLLVRGTGRSARGHVAYAVPWPRELPVESTTWAVSRPADTTSIAWTAPMASTSDDVRLARLRRMLVELESVDEAPAEWRDARPARVAWHAAWRTRWDEEARSLARELDAAPASTSLEARRAELVALGVRVAKAEQRLGVADESAAAWSLPPSAAEVDWLRHSRVEWPTFYAAVDGPLPELQLPAPAVAAGPWGRWLGVAVALALLLAARRWGLATDWLRRWPHAVGVAAGLVWWLALEPSFVGWVIVALTLLAGYFPAVRAARDAASTVVRLSIQGR